MYAKGNVELLNTTGIAIIGSRCCSKDGIKIAKKFARELSMQGLTIISGLAKGIDAAAHEGALEVGGNTIAVLGNGFNNIFPSENERLFKEVVKKGVAITEYPENEKARSKYFIERNRIVSGLSIGVLVVEAAHRSGTSVTAAMARCQQKEVFCIPHAINDRHGVGTNRLIAKGAKLVTNIEEIMEEFSYLNYDENKKVNLEKIVKHNVKKEYQEIYDVIKFEPITKEEICYKTKKSIREVNVTISILEMEGYVKKVASGYVCNID